MGGEGAFHAVGFGGIAGLLGRVAIVCGHYGVGKTSLSMSLAIDAARAGYETVLSDMDVVNPYFRSSDYKDVLVAEGVQLIEPVYARSNVDGTSITNETAGAVEWAVSGKPDEAPRLLIIDAGGDDSGATALGRFSQGIKQTGYTMLYVVNRQRGFDHTPLEAIGFLREIEEASHLQASGIVGNSHLKSATSLATVEDGISFAQEVALLAELPLSFITVSHEVLQQSTSRETERIQRMLGNIPAYDMGLYVRAPWE